MMGENDYFFHVIYVMFLELLQATKIHTILISRGCDPTYYTWIGAHAHERFQNVEKSLEGSIGVLYGRT